MTEENPANPKDHPIYRAKYVVPTPALEELLDEVVEWVDNFYTGSMIYGYQRLGKTSAIKYIRDEIKKLFGAQAMVGIAPMVTDQKLSAPVFWGQLLKALGHSLWASGTGPTRRNRLIKHLEGFSKDVGDGARVVLFIDDAQKLDESHFDWLCELHNILDLDNIHFSVFLVGQPELLEVKNSQEESFRHEVMGRFMNEEFQFHGIRNKDEIAVILNSYDENTEYPKGSGCSYTKHFFPEAYASGWRLEDETDKLWSAFLDIRNSHDLSEDAVLIDEIHMEYFARTVDRLYKLFHSKDPGFIGFSQEQILTAIKKSGYVGGSKRLRYKEILPKPVEA